MAKTMITFSGDGFSFAERFGPDAAMIAEWCGKRRVYRKFVRFSHAGGEFPVDLSTGSDPAAAEFRKEISYAHAKAMLPVADPVGYFSFGIAGEKEKYFVNERAEIFYQPPWERNFPSAPTLTPAAFGIAGGKGADASHGARPDDLSLLDGVIPVLFARWTHRQPAIELTLFSAHGDADGEPSFFVRRTEYGRGTVSFDYFNAGYTGKGTILSLDPAIFYDALAGILADREENLATVARISVPEKEVERGYYGALAAADAFYYGAIPRYGHGFYGVETHDDFPPNYIASIYTDCVTGNFRRARDTAAHFLHHVADARGSIRYRQGDSQLPSYSASEIGQILWLAGRYRKILLPAGRLKEELPILCRLADGILSRIAENEDGETLIRMCAEADTNGRIYEYLQNSMWAVRGLDALSDLPGVGERYREAAKKLHDSIKSVLKKHSEPTRFGLLPPVHLGYPILPLTLSRCRETTFPVPEQVFSAYMSGNTNPRKDIEGSEQSLSENVYANYRYYPEMLSSRLLPEEQEEAVEELRAGAGGEYFGMTRLFGGLDDWPCYNMALYFLDCGKKERFLTLLYAHLIAHGNEKFHTYYEQMKLRDGQWTQGADTSLPSQLLVPWMLAIAFVHETVDGSAVEICKGVPDPWWREGFSAKRIGTSFGKVSLGCRKGKLTVRIHGKTDKKIRIFLPDGSSVAGQAGTTVVWIER